MPVIAPDADVRPVPVQTFAGFFARAVEKRSDRPIWHPPRQGRDQLRHILGRGPSVPSHMVLAHAQGRVIPALPADRQAELVGFDGHNDLVDHRAQDALASLGRRARAVPGALYIGAKIQQRLSFLRREGRLGMSRGHVSLSRQVLDRSKPFVPALLEFGRDQAVVGIDGVVLTPRLDGFVAGLFKGEVNLPLLLRRLAATRFQRGESGFDAERLEPFDDFIADSAINAHAAEGDAGGADMVELGAAAMIPPS